MGGQKTLMFTIVIIEKKQQRRALPILGINILYRVLWEQIHAV
jgi:hypothetical protein